MSDRRPSDLLSRESITGRRLAFLFGAMFGFCIGAAVALACCG